MALRNLRILLIALGAVLAISAIFGMKGPLQDVHWDAPIYIARAKQFAETPYLRDYMSGAAEIADGMSRWKIGEDTDYWGFIRLGKHDPSRVGYFADGSKRCVHLREFLALHRHSGCGTRHGCIPYVPTCRHDWARPLAQSRNPPGRNRLRRLVPRLRCLSLSERQPSFRGARDAVADRRSTDPCGGNEIP